MILINFVDYFINLNLGMNHISKFSNIVVLILVVQFSSCITAHKINYLQQPNAAIPAYKDTFSFNDYKLKKGDRVFIKIYSWDEKTNALLNGSSNIEQLAMSGSSSGNELYTYLIQPSGKVNLPMIGEVYLEGQTVREAKETLEKLIRPVFEISSVDVRITGRFFSVIGGGATGRYPLNKEKINIFEALAMAGDIDTYGDRSKIRIIRETNRGTQVKFFDVRSVDIIHSEFYYVEPNDVIYIQDMNEQFFSVTSFASLLSTVFATLSFGIFIYGLAR